MTFSDLSRLLSADEIHRTYDERKKRKKERKKKNVVNIRINSSKSFLFHSISVAFYCM
jgi:hypothetical protein